MQRGGSCPTCGEAVAEGARFCAQCGARLALGDGATAVIPAPPAETGRVPVHVVTATPRYFGVTPPIALLVIAVATIVAAVLLLVLAQARLEVQPTETVELPRDPEVEAQRERAEAQGRADREN